MGKFMFRYGTMNSGKSLTLLTWRHNYEEAGFQVKLLKPAIDTRDGFISNRKSVVSTRVGLSAECDLVYPDENIEEVIIETNDLEEIKVIMVDEAQFLTKSQVKQLRSLAIETDVTIVCFGLLTDSNLELFEGSAALMALSDDAKLAEKTVCKCGKRATINARFDDKGYLIEHGEQVQIGGNESYRALCKYCYTDEQKRKRANYPVGK